MLAFPYGVEKLMTFSFFTAIRASHYRTLTQATASDKGLIITTPDSWFVKIVSTLFLCSNSLDDRFLGYFREHLTPSHVLEVVKRFNNPNLGFKFFRFTRERLSMSHSFWTYNMLLRSLCQAGLHNSAKLLYDSMRSDGQLPDSRLLGFLVSSFALADRFDVSKELLAEAQCSGVQVDVIVYNNFLNILIKHNRLDDAICLFRELMRSHSCLDAFTFNILIRGLCTAGDVDEAFELLGDMGSFGCSPDIVTALCKSNRLQEARNLLRILKQSDIVPLAFVYNPVIDGYCKSGNIDEANAIVAEMEEKCKPDKLTFTILIIGHCMKGRTPEAIGIFYKMLASGCTPDDITIRTLSSCLLKSGMPGEAARIKETLFENQESILKKSYHESINADKKIPVH
ncbi:hypothetical protein JHK84_046521 [Glycine max]|nr:hypothetical protein JHK84_046521 [Glycine max]